MEENNKLREKMIVLNHDISNPLQTILMNIEIIFKTLKNSNIDRNIFEKLQLCLEKMIDAIKAVQLTVHDVLDINQEVVPYKSLQKLLEEIAIQYEDLYNSGVRSYEFADNTISQKEFYDYNIDKIIRIMNNLLSNATKYTPNGMIIITLEEEENHYIIKVKDNGYGIPKEKLDKIFDKSQINSQFQTMGLGIGLSIVKDLVKSMNGEIRIASTIGLGTQISILIPKIRQDVLNYDLEKLEIIMENMVELNNQIIYRLSNEKEIKEFDLNEKHH
jgi:signal transduction histidine kinase